MNKYLVDVGTWKEECNSKPPVIETAIDEFDYYRDIIKKTAFPILSRNKKSRSLIRE